MSGWRFLLSRQLGRLPGADRCLRRRLRRPRHLAARPPCRGAGRDQPGRHQLRRRAGSGRPRPCRRWTPSTSRRSGCPSIMDRHLPRRRTSCWCATAAATSMPGFEVLTPLQLADGDRLHRQPRLGAHGSSARCPRRRALPPRRAGDRGRQAQGGRAVPGRPQRERQPDRDDQPGRDRQAAGHRPTPARTD